MCSRSDYVWIPDLWQWPEMCMWISSHRMGPSIYHVALLSVFCCILWRQIPQWPFIVRRLFSWWPWLRKTLENISVFCTRNLVLVTQRVTAWVNNFIVNQNSWRNDIPEHNHYTISYVVFRIKLSKFNLFVFVCNKCDSNTSPICFDFYIVIIRTKIVSSTSVVRCVIADTVYK